MSSGAPSIIQPGRPYIPGDETPTGQPISVNGISTTWDNLFPATTTSSGGGGGGGSQPALPSMDWAAFFWGQWGLPSDLIDQINKTLAGVSDETTALVIGTNLLRSSSWYAQTFPGIGYGIRNGLFTDETGYRDYVNRVNQLYQQYYGRAVTSGEVANYLQLGNSYDYVGNLLQGQAISQAEGPTVGYQTGAFDAQGKLTPAELTAYGQEKAGIDTLLGQQVALRVQRASQRLNNLFTGKLANPSLSIGPQGLNAPSIQSAKNTNSARSGSPDVAAL